MRRTLSLVSVGVLVLLSCSNTEQKATAFEQKTVELDYAETFKIVEVNLLAFRVTTNVLQ